MEVGDKIYRYKFDFETGETSTDVFVVTYVSKNDKSLRAEPDELNPDTKLHSGITFSANHFGDVKTSRRAKYVLLDHDDLEEALKLVHDYVRSQLREAEERVLLLKKWHGQLFKWKTEL